MPRRKTPVIFVVSDGRGDTANQLVNAAAVQFDCKYRVVRESEVRTPEQIEKVVRKAAKAGAVVFYTLVSGDTRLTMRRVAEELVVPSVDILGPAFTALHDLFGSERTETPGLLYAVEREKIDRMEAIDYTLRHDDGQRPHELPRADVVLVGVSRAAKSSTCFFLAYQGIRAANVPLVPGIEPPPELIELPTNKVIGLRVNVDRIITVRGARADNLGLAPDDPYLDRRTVAAEVNAAHRTMERHGWPSVEASYLAVEEIAREVTRIVRGGTPVEIM